MPERNLVVLVEGDRNKIENIYFEILESTDSY